MNVLEKRMYDLLCDMKKSHNLSGIKISFEDEGLTMEQAQTISSIAFKAGVDVSMKIGGAEAKRDLRDAKVLGVHKVVAPMIETSYSLKKYIDSAMKIYPEDEMDDTKFMANIETITGFQNIESMLSLPKINKIYGFVLGRTDFTGSLGESKSYVNSDAMFKIASEIAVICKRANKHLFIGGNVNSDSIDFFRRLSEIHLDGLETRNVIFGAELLKTKDVNLAIEKALNFESLWLQAKNRNYETILNEDKCRIEDIQSRLLQRQK